MFEYKKFTELNIDQKLECIGMNNNIMYNVIMMFISIVVLLEIINSNNYLYKDTLIFIVACIVMLLSVCGITTSLYRIFKIVKK